MQKIKKYFTARQVSKINTWINLHCDMYLNVELLSVKS